MFAWHYKFAPSQKLLQSWGAYLAVLRWCYEALGRPRPFNRPSRSHTSDHGMGQGPPKGIKPLHLIPRFAVETGQSGLKELNTIRHWSLRKYWQNRQYKEYWLFFLLQIFQTFYPTYISLRGFQKVDINPLLFFILFLTSPWSEGRPHNLNLRFVVGLVTDGDWYHLELCPCQHCDPVNIFINLTHRHGKSFPNSLLFKTYF